MTMYQENVGQVWPQLADRFAQHLNQLVEFHTQQIQPDSNEEDVEMRERQIMRLQQEFSEARETLRSGVLPLA